jgi:hypothetical protein
MMANSGKAATVARLVIFIVVSFCFLLESKAFFFEKKNQKTFVNLARAGFAHVVLWTKVFLLLFFQKKKFLLPSLTTSL